MSFPLYFDDDSQGRAVIAGLRRLGIECHVSSGEGMEGAPDADHLELAAAQGWCIVTRNESDFLRLDASYQQRFVEHAGIIIVHQWRRLSIGAELRAFAAIEAALVPDEVRNRVEYLSRWVTT